jgi:hypothetical protein
MAYITPYYQRSRAIYTERMRFNEFIELPDEHREALQGIWMGNAIRDENFRYSQRLANQKWVGGVWEHALIERESGRRECWIIFRPDTPNAEQFHSYEYWKKYWKAGDTIMCSGTTMGWCTLLDSDKIIVSVRMDKVKYMSEWDLSREIKKISAEYGI